MHCRYRKIPHKSARNRCCEGSSSTFLYLNYRCRVETYLIGCKQRYAPLLVAPFLGACLPKFNSTQRKQIAAQSYLHPFCCPAGFEGRGFSQGLTTGCVGCYRSTADLSQRRGFHPAMMTCTASDSAPDGLAYTVVLKRQIACTLVCVDQIPTRDALYVLVRLCFN